MKKAVIIPIMIFGLLGLAFVTTNAYRVPTLEIELADSRPAAVRTAEFVVDGLRCRGTSGYFAEKISSVPGVVSLTTYARTNLAVVEYDPALAAPDAIRAAYEAPDTIQGQVVQVFTTREVRDTP